MEPKKTILAGFLAGVVISIISLTVSSLVQYLFQFNVLDLGGMRAKDDPVMLLFFLHPWVVGFAMAFVYSKLEKAISGDYIQKGLRFGLLIWLVSSIPSAFIVYSSMNYPIGFTVNSVLGTILYMTAAGIVIARTIS